MVSIKSGAGLQAVSIVSWCSWVVLKVDSDEIDRCSQENGPPVLANEIKPLRTGRKPPSLEV